MFDIRLVAYEPFGERLGELPSPLHIEAGDPLSDMPSMRVKYSTSSAGSPLLNREVEVALEAYNPRAGAWFEPPNCRFVNVRSEGDSLDQADGISYTLPGYSWLLSRIQVFPLSASFVNGQVSDATKSEKTARDALNASQDALLRATNKPKGTTVEIDSSPPSNQKTVWVDMTKPEAPVVKVYQNNQWVKAAASVQDAGKRAGALWVQHQQTQGKLKDVQDRSRLTKRTFNGRHAGSIFAELLEEARARGNRLSGMQATFTKTHDSAGKPWPANPGVIQVNTGSDLGALLTTFVEGGQLDFRTSGRKLDVYVQDTELSRDASDSAVLRYGYHIDEAPDKSTIEGLAGSMLFIGDDGLIFSRDNPQAAQPWGVWESSVSQSGVKSVGVGERYARSALQEAAQRRVERTRGLVFHEGVTAPLPYVDYRPGDFVAAPGSNGSNEKQRVQQITLTKDGKTGQVAGNIVLNDRFLEREIKNSRSLKAVMGGGSIGGTGGSRDQETYVDLRSPVPPRYVKGEAVGNYVKNLGIQAYMDVDWYWEARATNGTEMTDALTSFQVRYRLVQEGTSGTGPANSMAWVAAPDAPGDERQTTIGPIEGWNRRAKAPAVYEVIVRACANNGKVSEWSKAGTIQVLTDNEPPLAPSRPGARAEGSVLWVEWNGKMASGGTPPADFLSANIYEAKVPEDAPRDENTKAVDDDYLNALSYTLVDSTPLTEAGAAPVFDRKYGEQYAYKLTAVDFFGNESEQSAPSQPVHTVPLVDDTFLQDQLKQAREESARIQAELDKKLEEANDAISAGTARLDGVVDSVTHAEEAALASDKKATDALSKAGAAQVSASGKTTITRALEPRTTQPGTAVGDTHFTMSSMGGGGQVLRQQRWDGSTWQDESLSHQVIASLDLGKATVGELDGIMVKAGSITSDRLSVGPSENSITDAGFTNLQISANRVTRSGGAWVRGLAAADTTNYYQRQSYTGVARFHFYPLPGTSFDMSGMIPTSGGTPWRFRADVNSGGGTAQFGVYYINRDGSTAQVLVGEALVGGNARRTITADWTAPSTVMGMQPFIQFDNGTTARTSTVYGGAQARPKVGTVLIEDGAITGDKVNAQSVAAATGKFLSLDVGQLTTTGVANINEAVVNNLWAKKIASKKIVTNEMLIGSGTNLVVNGYGEMEDGTNFSTFEFEKRSEINAPLGVPMTFSTKDTRALTCDEKVQVSGGANYAWKVSSRGQNEGQVFYFQARWYDAGGSEVGGTYLVNQAKVATDEWSTYAGIVKAPDTATSAVLAFYCNHVRGTRSDGQWHRVGGVEFKDATEGRLIVDGSISTRHVNAETFDVTKLLKANSIEAQYLKVDQIKDAIRIDSRLFYGQAYYGGSFVGAQFVTSEKAGARALFNQGGFYAFDKASRKTVEINADTGDVSIVGEFSTAPLGQPGIKLVNSASSWNNSDLGMWFTLDGNAYGWGGGQSTSVQERSVAGIFLTPDSRDVYWNTLRLRGRGRQGDILAYGGLTVTPGVNNLGRNPFLFLNGTPRQHIASNAELQITAGSPEYHGGKVCTGGGDLQLYTGSGNSKFYARAGGTVDLVAGGAMGFEVGNGSGIYLKSAGMSRYNKLSSKGGTLRIAADGCIVEDLSSADGKRDIKPAAPDERIFDVQPVTYIERGLEEEYERLDAEPRPMTQGVDAALRAIECGPERMFSAVAEDVHEIGLTELVNYDLNDKPASLRLEAFALKLLPFVKELWEFKKTYEPVIQKLAS